MRFRIFAGPPGRIGIIEVHHPNSQRPALIDRFPLVQQLPRNHDASSDEQNGERDMDPLSHDGTMSGDAAEIENLRMPGPKLSPPDRAFKGSGRA
jgi:hypothetical protein